MSKALACESQMLIRIRLVPIANYLLPAPSAPLDGGAQPAVFRRPSEQQRSSLPISGPSTPVKEPLDSIRSPSPETIARMSNTGPAMSPSSRTASFERRSLPAVTSLGDEAELGPGSPISKQRSRSPKPETDGRLDRGFKFPVAGSSKSHGPTIRTQLNDSEGSLRSPPVQTPIVHIQAPSTDGPISAPVGYTPVEEEIKESASEDKEGDTPPSEDAPAAPASVEADSSSKQEETAAAEADTGAVEPAPLASEDKDVQAASKDADSATLPTSDVQPEQAADDKTTTAAEQEDTVDDVTEATGKISLADEKETVSEEKDSDDKAKPVETEDAAGQDDTESKEKDDADDSETKADAPTVTSAEDAAEASEAAKKTSDEAQAGDSAKDASKDAESSKTEELAEVDLR